MVDNKVMVSIITPFYNGNKYMDQLFSVIENNSRILKETFPQMDVELLIVNDSPQVKIEIPQETNYFHYKIIEHKVNSGIHQARVTGLNVCKGEYVLFLDQDDELKNDALVCQMRVLLEDDSYNIVICNAYMEREDGTFYELYKTKTSYERINDLQFYLKAHNVIKSPGQCLIKKTCIPDEWKYYIMKKNGSDDLFLWILFLEKSYRFIINKRILYTHKYTGENLSESNIKMGNSSLEIVDFVRHIDYVPLSDMEKLKRSRKFDMDLHGANAMNKVVLICKNMDLVFYRLAYKIKSILV